jgi:hypothetical protein
MALIHGAASQPAGRAQGRQAAWARRRIGHRVQIGGQTKAELVERLRHSGVEINESGRILFESDRFITSDVATELATVELSVHDLGFPQGATLSDVFAGARRVGLRLCPLELGPHLRLQLLDQAEGFVGQPVWRHRAPPGSITIASEALSDDDEFPKGFYLRRIQGTPWLRGYRCGPEHVWDPEDRLLFAGPR